MSRHRYMRVKRIFDTAASLIGIVAALPVIAAAGAMIMAEDGGPVIYRQQRVGRMGASFEILKLRTMRENAAGQELTLAGDERVTRAGKLLRQYKLDELPQFINVLRGDMSLVGPRPEVPRYMDFYTSDEMEALLVRPGITDPASILYWNESERLSAMGGDPEDAYLGGVLRRKLMLSIFYQRHATLSSDIKVLLCTLRRAFAPK